MSKIIDIHGHFMPSEVAKNTAFFKVNWSDIERQLGVMEENAIDQSLLLYPTSDAHLNMNGWQNVCDVYNEEIASTVKKYPGKFIGAGILPVDQPENMSNELEKIKNLGLRVLSLASSYDGKYLDDEKFDEVFVFASKHNMPVHVHSQIMNPIGQDRVRDPLLSPVLEYVFDVSMCIGKMMMEGVFSRHSETKFIFAHYGGALPLVKERFDTTYAMLRKREFVKDLSKAPSEYFRNLYFDTSGSKSSASLMCALELVDASHILYGSDYPANTMIKESIGFLKNIGLTEDQQNSILSENFLRLLS